MSKKKILWVKKTALSEKAIKELKKIYGEIELFQFNDFGEDMLALAEKFNSVDVIAFQLGSLPPELERDCLNKAHIVHEIDEHFNFDRWSLSR
jgi:hypothetical protein